jgi:anti-sigma factor RsiW
MSSLELTCSVLTERATDYLDQSLPPEEELAFETHLVYCAPCGRFVRQLREVVAGLAALPRAEADPGERASLLAAYRGRA